MGGVGGVGGVGSVGAWGARGARGDTWAMRQAASALSAGHIVAVILSVRRDVRMYRVRFMVTFCHGCLFNTDNVHAFGGECKGKF